MKKRFLYITAAMIMAVSPFSAMASTLQTNTAVSTESKVGNVTDSGTAGDKDSAKTDGEAEKTESSKETESAGETAEPAETAKTEETDNQTADDKKEEKFNDVDKDAWYAEAVNFVVTRGVMSGISENTFSPDAQATRGTIALIIKNIDGTSEKVYWSYLDVPEDAWYADAVAWCSETNIMKGYGGGYFGPDDSITREQLVSILYRYAQYRNFSNLETTGVELLEYNDYANISGYAGGPMQWALKNSIISGKENNMLDPQGIATRAEIAQIIRNFMVFYNL